MNVNKIEHYFKEADRERKEHEKKMLTYDRIFKELGALALQTDMRTGLVVQIGNEGLSQFNQDDIKDVHGYHTIGSTIEFYHVYFTVNSIPYTYVRMGGKV